MAKEKSRNIPIEKIHDLPGLEDIKQPDKAYGSLVSSILINGVKEPVILRHPPPKVVEKPKPVEEVKAPAPPMAPTGLPKSPDIPAPPKPGNVVPSVPPAPERKTEPAPNTAAIKAAQTQDKENSYVTKVILTGDRRRKYFPDVSMTPREIEDSVYDALEERRQRQAEGIAAAKARGVRFGRPTLDTPELFKKIVYLWEKINIQEALEQCGMTESTFHQKAQIYRTAKK